MTELVRYCPSCYTERAVHEVSCEGVVDGHQCNWPLLEVQITPSGWRPTEVVPADSMPAATSPVGLICTNGHALEEGDFLCPICGSEATAGSEATEGGGPATLATSETVIAGWRVLRQVGSTAGRRDRYQVEEDAGERRGILTLYHHGWEPDPTVYDALRRVSLEHVPQILATGRWEDRAYEVAEELTGGTLADLGVVATDSAGVRRIAYELGKALDALTEVGLRHRDIRPGTLLVRNRDPVDLVIGGFGSARLSEYDLDIVSPLEVTKYTAPEAVAGGVAAASDWWSLGIVLLEQVTDGRCFEGIEQQAFLIHVLANGVPIPSDVPQDVALLLRGLLARDRHKRWKWKEVQAWLNGQSPEAPEAGVEDTGGAEGPALTLGGKRFRTLSSYALASAGADAWEEARDQLVRGVITDWAQSKGAPVQQIAGLRRIAKDASVTDDWRLLVALKVLNPDMPPVMKGAIVSPKWLLESPLEGYDLICGPVPDLLHELDQDNWLLRLKVRAATVRERADHLAIDLDEDTLRIYLLSTSRARLSAEWDSRRRVFPDSEHLGLLNLLERRSLSEEDLIVVLSAAPSQFRSCDAIVEEARLLAVADGVATFDVRAAADMVTWPRGEILEATAERVEGFALCGFSTVNGWADQFRLERRMSLAQALVLLSVPQDQWQEPHRQQYVSDLLSFFEKKVVNTVMRGPLVRMSIGKSTPRVDLKELHTNRVDAGGLLDHLLKRDATALVLDPAALDPLGTTGYRLQALDRQSELYKRDTGINGLYLGFPFLLTKEAKSGAKTRIAPVLLWPVRVRHEVGARSNVQVSFDSDREEVRLNPALETLVGQETVKKWAKVAEELLGRSALRAADVIDAFGTLATPRSRELAALPGLKVEVPAWSMELECAGVLFHMTFMGQAIGEEIRNLRSKSLAGTGLETALRLNTGEASAVPGPVRPKEADRYFTMFSDPSQEAAVLQARAAPGLLVEGPPGTGKSQTIVNMVGDAIGQGRSVLIVCQKHAALEVVHKRLVAEDLGDRIVMVNDVNKDRLPIIRAVREQLEELVRSPNDSAAQVRRKREAVAARIESNEATLDKHHAALHHVDEAVGLSYRVLLGELIEFEQAGATLEVPALRAMLQRLNIGQLATLEEEVAPAVPHWLPAKYESSSLAHLQPFAADLATLNDFREAFDKFAQLEEVRHQVLTTRSASFEVEDPRPHQTWLSSYGSEFLQISDEQRACLAKWLPLFRGASSELAGLTHIDHLRKLRDGLSACRSQDYDAKLSPVLCRVSPDKLEQLRALTAEAIEPLGFFARLNVFRMMRKGRVTKFLLSVGDHSTSDRMVTLLAALQLEQSWRPLRKAMGELHSCLSLPGVEADAGPAMLQTVSKTLIALQTVAEQAVHLQAAPWLDRVDKAALTGGRESFLTLYAEFDAAFARHQARSDSLVALAALKPWMQLTWMEACQQAVIRNDGNGQRVQPIVSAMPSLAAYQLFRGRAAQMSQQAMQVLAMLRGKEGQLLAIPAADLDDGARRILGREARLAWKQAMEHSTPELSMEQRELANKVAVLEQLDKEMRLLNRQLLQVNFDMAAVRPLREWEDITRLTGQRSRRLREFIELGAGLGLMKLRPVWMMNPDVASRVLPLKPGLFDTVIYDEASQMPVEFALPTLFRGKVSVVSGDEKQMPPTAFFASRVESDEGHVFDGELPDEDATPEEKDEFEETWNRREIKDCPDLLQLARANLPNTRLQIHYRSSYRELIGYSNAAFYANDLNVPVRHPEDVVRAARPIEMVRVDGVYKEQTNPEEAQRVVDILAQLWAAPAGQRPSVGIVTFNRKQADLIEDLLEVRAESDAAFRAVFSQESERYEDGEDMSVFVKNVENVQGDERDIIVFSSTFGRNAQGSFLRFFGVLGQKGGERRLNVAITRSRKKVYMVTSMPIPEISDLLSTKRAPATPRDFLQGYMEYARLVSSGEFTAAKSLLSRITPRREATRASSHASGSEDAFYRAVGDFLRSLGHQVKAAENADAFGLDYAIEHPRTGYFAIGIECDAPRHPLLQHARAREVWRRQVLERSLPVLHRVSCHGWYHDGEQERIRLLNAIKMSLDDKEAA